MNKMNKTNKTNKTNILSLVYLIEQIARTRMNIHSMFSLTQRAPGQIPCAYEYGLCIRGCSYMERKWICSEDNYLFVRNNYFIESVYYNINCIKNISCEGISLYKLHDRHDISNYYLNSSLNKLCKYLNELDESGRNFAWYRRKHMIIA